MNKIETTSITEKIYRYLLDAIINQEINAGEKLVEENISAELGVSRTPVREALNRLTSEGFILFKPRTGRFVKQFSKKDIGDIFELRCLLETKALRLAVKNIAEKEFDKLLKMLDKCEGATNGRSIRLALEIDDLLHELFCSNCGNSYLEEYLRHLINLSLPFRNISEQKTERMKELNKQRRSIISAIKEEKIDLACESLENHIRDGKNFILERMKD